MKWSKDSLQQNFNKYISLSQKERPADFVIWGETATPFLLDMEEEHLKEMSQAIPENGHLITGLVRYEPNEEGRYQPLNSSFIIDDKLNILDYYDKSHLVPFGEYIPLRKYLPDSIRPVTNQITNFKAGPKHKKINIKNYPSFGILICYEIIFPSEIINKDNRPEWLINLTNDGWYGDSSGPRQHFVSTQLRAIEEGITIARVANTGISGLFSKTGKVLGKIDLNVAGNLDIKLPKNLSITTPYSRLGNLIPLALVLLCLAASLIFARKT